MKKLLFFGDSITDMGRSLEDYSPTMKMGMGYVFMCKSKLSETDPTKYKIINTGISGNRVVDLYARVKIDCWNYKPDVITILIGVNDLWHEASHENGVEPERYDKVYRMLIEDTIKKLPNVKIILMEPFILDTGTYGDIQKYILENLHEYQEIVRNIAKDYNLNFVELQKSFDEAARKYGPESFLYDGIHPEVAGATLIANEWMKEFKRMENDL